MSEGIIYLNIGNALLARLATSIHSLRKVYRGNVSIICDGASYDYCKRIAFLNSVDVKLSKFDDIIPDKIWLNKTRINKFTPYDYSLLIDSDTIVQHDPSSMIALAKEHEFVWTQFRDRTMNYPRERKRVQYWHRMGLINAEEAENIVNFGPAIHDGNFAFSKSSTLMSNWYLLTLIYINTKHENREVQNYITKSMPTEAACQMLLLKHKNKVVDCSFNWPCKLKYFTNQVKIIHYYGSRHCEKDCHSDVWFREFNEIKKSIAQFIHFDKKLSEFLAKEEQCKNLQ